MGSFFEGGWLAAMLDQSLDPNAAVTRSNQPGLTGKILRTPRALARRRAR
jgi:hypothetical protein